MSERGVRRCSVLVLCAQRRQHAVVQVDQGACRLVDDDIGDKRSAPTDLVFPVLAKGDQDTLIVSDDAIAIVVIRCGEPLPRYDPHAFDRLVGDVLLTGPCVRPGNVAATGYRDGCTAQPSTTQYCLHETPAHRRLPYNRFDAHQVITSVEISTATGGRGSGGARPLSQRQGHGRTEWHAMPSRQADAPY